MLTSSYSNFNLTTQQFPDSYVADVSLDRTKSLDSLQVYLTAVNAVRGYGTNLPWEHEVSAGATLNLKACNVDLSFRRITTRQSRQRLQVGHVVLGIYKAVNTMAEEGVFCNTNVIISIRGERVGKVIFERRFSVGETNTRNYTDATPVCEDFTKPGLDIFSGPKGTNFTAIKQSGEIIDDEDPNFRLTYNFNGPAIPPQDVFSATLDAGVTIARTGLFEVVESLSSESHVGVGRIRVYHFDSSKILLSIASISKALQLLVEDVMLPQIRFSEVSFEIWRNEEPFATGFVANSRAKTDIVSSS